MFYGTFIFLNILRKALHITNILYFQSESQKYLNSPTCIVTLKFRKLKKKVVKRITISFFLFEIIIFFSYCFTLIQQEKYIFLKTCALSNFCRKFLL